MRFSWFYCSLQQTFNMGRCSWYEMPIHWVFCWILRTLLWWSLFFNHLFKSRSSLLAPTKLVRFIALTRSIMLLLQRPLQVLNAQLLFVKPTNKQRFDLPVTLPDIFTLSGPAWSKPEFRKTRADVIRFSGNSPINLDGIVDFTQK